jgi:hypothetical protein
MKRSDISDAEILEACKAFHNGEAKAPDESLAHKYPPKLILCKMERMVERGLLEYGVSLRTAWSAEYKKDGIPLSARLTEIYK